MKIFRKKKNSQQNELLFTSEQHKRVVALINVSVFWTICDYFEWLTIITVIITHTKAQAVETTNNGPSDKKSC